MAQWALFLGLAVIIVYGIFVGGLALAGRSSDARAVAGFVPDCIVLFQRLLGDSRMPRRYRAIVVALLGYLDHNDLHAPRAQSRRGDRAVPALPAADALAIEGR